jgi:hypothetical protein
LVQKCFTYQVLQKAVYFGYFIYSFVLCTSCIILHLQIPYECIKIRSLNTNYDSNNNFVVYRKKYNDGDAHLLQFSQNAIVQLHSWQFLSFGKRKNFNDDTNFAETPPSALQAKQNNSRLIELCNRGIPRYYNHSKYTYFGNMLLRYARSSVACFRKSYRTHKNIYAVC